MAQFRIEIAGRTAAVTSLFDSTRDYCRRYFSEKEPDFSVTVQPEDLILEQRLADEEALEEGFRRRKFTDPFLDRATIQRKIAEALLAENVLLLHGSTIAVDGEGFLFTAKSGTGKSTHTRLWRETFGSRAVMVNDDKPFLRITEAGVLACGAPWSGKHGLDTNITVPLRGICVLERGSENRIVPADMEEILPLLLHQGSKPLEERRMPRYEMLVKRLAAAVPLWRMDCTPEPRAAQIAWAAMSGQSYFVSLPQKESE